MTLDALAHGAALVFGVACVALFFRSIIVAVFLDRPRHDFVALLAAILTRAAFALVVSRGRSQERIDRALLWYWPLAQFATIYAWYVLVIVGFGAVNWGIGASPDLTRAMIASGSALSTLGFATPADVRGQVLAVIEGGIGLFVVVFLLTFIPGYLLARQERAGRVAHVYARTGAPPSGAVLLAWYFREGKAAELDRLFEQCEAWIRDLGVSHSQSPGLAVTRSNRSGEYWVSAVVALMDAAAVARDVVEGPSASAAVFLLTARQALDSVAAATRAVPRPAPAASRADFDAACGALAATGAPLKADRDAAWAAFQTTQAGYADLCVGLATRIHIGATTYRFTGRTSTP